MLNLNTRLVNASSSVCSASPAEPRRGAPAGPRSRAGSPQVPRVMPGAALARPVGPHVAALSVSPQNTDAALLPCISYPAFALDDEALFNQTLDKVVRKLKGKYGFKRFLRDGYRTSLEDPNRRYYKPAEIKVWRKRPASQHSGGSQAPARRGLQGRSPALPLPRLGQVPRLEKRPVSRAGSLLPHQPFPEPWAGSGGLPGDPEVLFIDTSSPGGGEGQGCSWSRHAVSPGGEGAVSPRRQVLHLCVPRLAPGAPQYSGLIE